MGDSCRGIKNLRSSHEHGRWRIVETTENEARLDEAYKTKGDLIFSASRIKFTLFQAFSP
jgi:hypothetical protein